MLGLLGILGALLAGLTLDSGTDAPSAGREAEDNPADDEEAWGVSTAFMLGEDPAGGDYGGTEPDGQPISNDLPDEPDPDLALHGDEWDDTLEGGSGKDQIAGGAGDDYLSGHDGDDSLWGDAGNDLALGGAGADVLDGGAGDDMLHLGAGDYGNGGAGADSFVLHDFAAGSPVAQITDFNPDEDGLVIYYDQAMHPDPQLSLQTGDGASVLLLDGVPLVSLANGAVPDLSTITLRAA